MSRPRYRRTSGDTPPPRTSNVLVVLPHVVMIVAQDGMMTVTVDGQPHEPEPFAPPWQRASFGHVLDQLTARHRCALRVEVREADGTVFTDIITPATRHRPAPLPPTGTARKASPSPVLVAMHGEGFVPGEDVAVAVIIAHGDAAPDGTMRGLLSGEQLADSPTREVILLGRISGNVTIGRPE